MELQEGMNILTQKAKFYTQNQLPQQIGQAIYLFGNNEDYDILGFIDASETLDGSKGMILTSSHVYFQFTKIGSFAYQDIVSLSLEKHRHQNMKAIIQTNTKTYTFQNHYILQDSFINVLSKITGIEVKLILTLHEKIEYNIETVLLDIQNDEYEDVVLTIHQKKKLKDFFENLSLIHQMDDEEYQYELEVLCRQALEFFDELELESEEIEELITIQQQLHVSHDYQFDQAQSYYHDLMNKYQQGDSQAINQIQDMMNMLGINEEELRGKSPEEIQAYLYDLCDRFGVSRSLLEKMMKK